MVDLGPVLSAATEYGDAREAEGRAAAEVVASERIAELNAAMLIVQAERDTALADHDTLLGDYAALRAEFDAYKIANPAPEPETPLKVIGMSSPATVWDQRLEQVGPNGVTARRIFAWLQTGGNDQINLVTDAVDNGLMPVISYKVASVPNAINGAYDDEAEQAATLLAAFDVPIRLAIWHEPHGDMTPAQFVALNERLLPIFKRGKVKVGCFLNGWLLDRRVPDFDTYTSPALFGLWDWFGIDTYESGTIDQPGDIKPGDRIPKLIAYLDDKGSQLPVGIGEYNGYTGESIAAAGEAILACDRLEFACMWNATTGKGYVLEGARLEAFKATKADPRVKQ
jgi:hypothetical protein